MNVKIGDKAPSISALDQNSNAFTLDSLRGSKVILYFYPKDDTPGCTAEACNLRDNYSDLLNRGFKIVGVSTDSVKSHQKFSEKYSLPFPLLADTDKKIVNDYGVWGKKKFMGREYDGTHRVTFVLSEEGTVLKIFDKVQTKEHAQQILMEIN
ncbi:MAG TPA: thioredoxin-dependent thiol peroxidase [Bacteroidales bacterium]|nr:thioredoxin-dependent thiol peroxidase [Bacteroidales bacterium]HOX78011.1 thioredoxin-dependent thiol peroxidase [Bacteroidales bacterium]HPI84974.1 thioredoxin-dependent thiol peroxidase [Bacteroidales bacterium]HPM91678.1 thioredoxin-dependent thiol peroxidase [Bacteroidales bacterium]